jgi:rubrerythrin
VSYQRWADNEADPQVARLLRLNGREESIHARRVEQVMALLSQPQVALDPA